MTVTVWSLRSQSRWRKSLPEEYDLQCMTEVGFEMGVKKPDASLVYGRRIRPPEIPDHLAG